MNILYLVLPLVLSYSYYFDFYLGVYAVLIFLFLDIFRTPRQYPSLYQLGGLAIFLLSHNLWLFSLYSWTGFIKVTLLYLGFSFYFFVLFALFLILIYFQKQRSFAILWIGISWYVFEYLLTLGPFGYPLYSLYLTQATSPYLFLANNFLGAGVISFLVVVVSGILAQVLLRFRSRQFRLYLAFLAFFILYAVVSYGNYILNSADAERYANRYLNVALVQPNIEQHQKIDSNKFSDNFASYLDLLEKIKSNEKDLDVIILPETIIPALWEENFVMELNSRNLIDRELLIFGLPIQKQAKVFNGIVYYQQGRIQKYYFKNQLVPLGEYLPLGLSFYNPNDVIYYSKGNDFSPVAIQSIKYGNALCFESAFFRLFRKLKAADLLIVLTNDAWFNDYFKHLHMRTAIFRAVELNKYLCFVGNTGFTAIISNNGQIVNQLPLNKVGYLKYQVPLSFQSKTKSYRVFQVLIPLLFLFSFWRVYLFIRKKIAGS